MREVYLSAEDVWGYAKQHKDELEKSDIMIGEDAEFNTQILLHQNDFSGDIHIRVVIDGQKEYEEKLNEQDCRMVVSDIVGMYLEDFEDKAQQREEELYDALEDFLNVVFCTTSTEEIIDPDTMPCILNGILDYIATNVADCIYRPIRDSEGTAILYPYCEDDEETVE